jgi:hypothetical protein
MDSNVDVAQSKVLIDPFLGGLLKEGRKIDPLMFLFFSVISKTSFKGLFFGL